MPSWLRMTFILVLVAAGLMLATPLGSGIARPGTVDYSTADLNSLIASMHEAKFDIHDSRIRLEGVALSGDEWTRSLARFRASTPDSIEISMDVFVIDTNLPLDGLCAGMFAALPEAQVRFRKSGSEIRTSSYATLDRTVDFTRDCRLSKVVVTGHSDATGTETINLPLSLARAQAVVDFLVAHGASANQLFPAGAGAAFPIADNETRHGREQNRRIEFSLLQAK